MTETSLSFHPDGLGYDAFASFSYSGKGYVSMRRSQISDGLYKLRYLSVQEWNVIVDHTVRMLNHGLQSTERLGTTSLLADGIWAKVVEIKKGEGANSPHEIKGPLGQALADKIQGQVQHVVVGPRSDALHGWYTVIYLGMSTQTQLYISQGTPPPTEDLRGAMQMGKKIMGTGRVGHYFGIYTNADTATVVIEDAPGYFDATRVCELEIPFDTTKDAKLVSVGTGTTEAAVSNAFRYVFPRIHLQGAPTPVRGTATNALCTFRTPQRHAEYEHDYMGELWEPLNEINKPTRAHLEQFVHLMVRKSLDENALMIPQVMQHYMIKLDPAPSTEYMATPGYPVDKGWIYLRVQMKKLSAAAPLQVYVWGSPREYREAGIQMLQDQLTPDKVRHSNSPALHIDSGGDIPEREQPRPAPGLVDSVVDAVSGAVGGAVDAVGGAVGGAVDAVSDTAVDVANGLVDTVKGMGTSVLTGATYGVAILVVLLVLVYALIPK
jgi:hypothetical protein